jgi:hypothetical protein
MKGDYFPQNTILRKQQQKSNGYCLPSALEDGQSSDLLDSLVQGKEPRDMRGVGLLL